MLRPAAITLAGGAFVLLALGLAVASDPADSVRLASPWDEPPLRDVRLVTQDGLSVRLYEDLLQGKVVLLSFLPPSCPGSCRPAMVTLAQVYELLGERAGRDVFMYSIATDPARDTPEALEALAATFHIGPGWLLLTGEATDLARLRARLGLLVESDSPRSKGPIGGLLLADASAGRWMRASLQESSEALAALIRGQLQEWAPDRPERSSKGESHQHLAERGQYLFQTRCAVCHTVGDGDRDGPDLRGVIERRGRAWLARWLGDPRRMLAERDPTAAALYAQYRDTPMPDLRLGAREVEALLAHLEARERR